MTKFSKRIRPRAVKARARLKGPPKKPLLPPPLTAASARILLVACHRASAFEGAGRSYALRHTIIAPSARPTAADMTLHLHMLASEFSLKGPLG